MIALPLSPQLLTAAVGAIFGAGTVWGISRAHEAATRRDVNAIGGIVRRDRWNMMIALMVILERREDRQRLADLLRQQ